MQLKQYNYGNSNRTSREKIKLDEDGYLQNIDSWDIHMAEELAKTEGIKKLTSEHWKLIIGIRLFYERNGVSPPCRHILKRTRLTKKDIL